MIQYDRTTQVWKVIIVLPRVLDLLWMRPVSGATSCHTGMQICFSYVWLCDPVDYSLPPGSSVHGIPQTRILEWVTMSSSRRSSRPRDRTWVSCLLHWQSGSLPLVPPRKPYNKLDFLEKVNFLLAGSRHGVIRITINHIAYRFGFFLIQIQVQHRPNN